MPIQQISNEKWFRTEVCREQTAIKRLKAEAAKLLKCQTKLYRINYEK